MYNFAMSSLSGTFNAGQAQDQLARAIAARAPEELRRALDAGADAAAKVPQGRTPAEEIVYDHSLLDQETELEFQQRERDCLQLLLDRGATIDDAAKKEIFESHGWLAPLFPDVQQAMDFNKAGMRRDAAELASFIGQGLHPDAAAHWGGNAALLYAVTYNNLELMETLLRAGADVNLVSPVCCKTPLLQAATYGHKEAFRLLIDWGADPEIQFKPGLVGGKAIDFAGNSETPGMVEFVKQLLDEREWNLAHPKPPEVVTGKAITVAKPFKLKG